MGYRDKNGNYIHTTPKKGNGNVVNPSLGKKIASYNPPKEEKSSKGYDRYEGIKRHHSLSLDDDIMYGEIYEIRKEMRDILSELREVKRELREIKKMKPQAPKISIH